MREHRRTAFGAASRGGGRALGVTIAVRRVRADEGERVRDLRLRAVSDPAASIAFLTTYEQELARDEAFWAERAAGGSDGGSAAMFVAEDGEEWVGSVTVLVKKPGQVEDAVRSSTIGRADVVGVFVAPEARGTGAIDALLDAAARWTADQGFETLGLEVHVDNHRAQAVYRRAGFVPTGETFTGPIGAELAMSRSLRTL